MNTTRASILAASILSLTCAALAGVKDYQVTGPVLEINNDVIVVQKGTERWEIARSAAAKTGVAVKAGDKVTVHYTMTATKIESGAATKAAAPTNAKIGAQKKE